MTTTPTPSAKLDEITTAIVKAVPDLYCTACEDDGCFTCTCRLKCCARRCTGRDPGLEDILRAKPGIDFAWGDISKAYGFFDDIGYMAAEWYPGLPLHQQSPETIDFLHSILCPKQ